VCFRSQHGEKQTATVRVDLLLQTVRAFSMAVSSPTTSRVLNPQLESKIMSAAEAAALIRSGDQIGMKTG
jgi:hypothetical protein